MPVVESLTPSNVNQVGNEFRYPYFVCLVVESVNESDPYKIRYRLPSLVVRVCRDRSFIIGREVYVATVRWLIR
jgi:hypothetical protein